MKTKAYIFDIDSTLSDVSERMHLACARKWEEFYEQQKHDKPIEATVEVLRALKEVGYTIIILTGRPDKYKEDTKAWLEKHKIPFDELVMQDTEKRMLDTDYKFCRTRALCENYEILGVFEDRRNNIKMFREMGLIAFDVAGNKF